MNIREIAIDFKFIVQSCWSEFHKMLFLLQNWVDKTGNNRTLMGSYVYDKHGKARQSFPIQVAMFNFCSLLDGQVNPCSNDMPIKGQRTFLQTNKANRTVQPDGNIEFLKNQFLYI